jgi:hypothetical protein
MGCTPVYAEADGSTSKFAGRSTEAACPQSIPRTGGPEGDATATAGDADDWIVGDAGDPHPAATARIAARARLRTGERVACPPGARGTSVVHRTRIRTRTSGSGNEAASMSTVSRVPREKRRQGRIVTSEPARRQVPTTSPSTRRAPGQTRDVQSSPRWSASGTSSSRSAPWRRCTRVRSSRGLATVNAA